MIRRFVNVVAGNYKTGVYSLHRLDVGKHLFHQSRADARAVPLLAEARDNTAAAAVAGDEQTTLDRLQELPEPWVKISSSFDQRVFFKVPFFGLLCPRSSEDKVLFINWMGKAVLCDANKQSGEPMLPLQEELGRDPISFSAVQHDAKKQGEEDLYFIHIASEVGVNPFRFRVLRSCNSEDCTGWRWESLPPLPCIDSPRYDPFHFIYSFAVVDGGRTLCLSSADESIGSYCFDTVERQWRHAGRWILPFQGRVEYVPDLKLWLGFSPCRDPYYNLCGMSDLNNTMSMYQQPPKLEYEWQDLVTPENWLLSSTQLINLGAGKFCIAKAFEVKNRCAGMSAGSDDDWEFVEDEFLVLTGVEVCTGGDERPMLWKHKSVQYGPSYNVKGVV